MFLATICICQSVISQVVQKSVHLAEHQLIVFKMTFHHIVPHIEFPALFPEQSSYRIGLFLQTFEYYLVKSSNYCEGCLDITVWNVILFSVSHFVLLSRRKHLLFFSLSFIASYWGHGNSSNEKQPWKYKKDETWILTHIILKILFQIVCCICFSIADSYQALHHICASCYFSLCCPQPFALLSSLKVCWYL